MSNINKIRYNGEDFNIGDEQREIYSTEETIVGTWIDNKPIYRKVFEGNLQGDQFVIFSGVDKLISTKGYIIEGGVQFEIGKSEYVTSNTVYNGQVSRIVNIDGAVTYQGTWKSSSYCLILEYTKTTD